MWETQPRPGELEVGDELGPYRLEQLLGEGGMGLVYRARRDRDGQSVALKILKLDLSDDETYRKRFVHEARSAAEVRHENLVPILDSGDLEGRQYLAAAYVAGQTLEDRIQSEGPLPLEGVLRLAEEVAAGLGALHEAGLVHRDVKASNILLAEDGTALLTDFGLAKGRAYTVLTTPGQVMGTLDYLAPELIRGEPGTPASDIYALGCVVYECVAGKTPFGDRGLLQIGIAHLEEEPADPGGERPDWSPALSAALLGALEKDPASRPSTATAYARALRAASESSA